jgi:hypothetical protein
METNYTQSNSSKPKTKKFAVIGITAGLLLGAGSGVLMNLPGGASAKSTTPQAISADDNSTTTKSADREAKLRETLQTLVAAGTIETSDVDAIVTALQTKPTTPPVADATGARPDKATMLKARLQTLVDDNTLTASQLDAVVTALEAARPMGGGHEGRWHGGQNHGGARGEKRQERLTTAAEAIGITAEELKTAIEGGQTIAQVAEANGKSVQSVIDALVAQASADLTQRISDMVNGVRPTVPAEANGVTAGA